MISFMGRTTLQFNNIVCSSDTNHCGLTVNGSQLAPNERYFVVVTASNGSGFGSSTIFPTQSELISIHGIINVYFPLCSFHKHSRC